MSQCHYSDGLRWEVLPLHRLELPTGIRYALASAGYGRDTTVWSLARVSDEKLLELRGIGPLSLHVIRERLRGLQQADPGGEPCTARWIVRPWGQGWAVRACDAHLVHAAERILAYESVTRNVILTPIGETT